MVKFGLAVAEENQHGILFTEESLAKIEKAGKDLEEAQAAVKTEKAARETAETKLATADTTISEQAAEIAELKTKLAAKPAEEKKHKQSGGENADESNMDKGKKTWSHYAAANEQLKGFGITI